MSNNKEGMTVEELLKPRYKVIADYPGSDFDIGNVLSKSHNLYEFEIEPGRIRNYSDHMIESYPHLFKRLEWYEDRELSDLPVYIRFGEFDKPHAIYKIIEWNPKELADCRQDFNPCGYAERPTEYFISLRFSNNFPATESEYLQYINSKQQP